MYPIAPPLHCSSTALTGDLTFRDELLVTPRGHLRIFQLSLLPSPLQRPNSGTARYHQTAPFWTMNGARVTNAFREMAAKKSRLGKRSGVDSKTALSGSVKSAN